MKCKNCGKIFDDEKYYGICPKCGTFQKQEKPQQAEETEKVSFGASGTDQSIYTYVEDGTAEPKAKPEKNPGTHKRSVAYVVICVILLLLSGILTGLSQTVQEKQLEKEAKLSDLPLKEVPAGEPAQIGTCTVTVLDAHVLEQADVRPEFPEGQMCVAVRLHVENTEEYPSYETALEVPYLVYTDADGNEIFKEALSSYDFSSYEVYYGLHLLESYDFGYESDAEGDVVFFTEPGATDVRLCLEDRYRPENRMQTLRAVYELPVELPGEVGE